MSIFSSLLNKFKGKNSEAEPVEGNDFDKYSSLLKEATKLKKEGDLEGAIKTIDKALLLHQNNSSVYKKAFYLQLNNQFDEAWKIMATYNEDTNVRLLEAIDWYTLKNAFYEYSDSSASLIKLLKKEKKTKELIYYLPGSEYNDLLARLTYPTTKLKDIISQIKGTDLSKKIKLKKAEDFNLLAFDSKYRKIVSSRNDDFKELHEYSQKSDFMYYYNDVPSGFSKEAMDKFDKVTEEAEGLVKQNEAKAFKILKDLWSKGIKLNDDCYKAAEIN
jgi:tetratricopeptide (TPR) repeat protein